MINEEEIKKLEALGASRFTFNGNIIAEIGEESISNPFIAVAELIKNSYDADSKQVTINLINVGKHSTKLVVSDDGVGMDSSDIKDRWMDIGSPHKRDIQLTNENKRVPVGAKGIGRFASHCLGKSMKLITASKNEHFGYKLLFDWKKFSSKVKATDVDVDTHRFKKKISTRGTTIVIEELKHEWNDGEKLKKLLKDLYLLPSPIDQPKNFRIKENLGQYSKGLKKLSAEFLDKAAYSFKIKLSKQKEIEYEFYKNNILVKKDKKELAENLNCGDASFELYFYYKNAQTWSKWIHKDINKKELDEVKSMLEEYGGIKLYRDRFRVKPYGEKDADWIGLDHWSRDTSIVPGNSQVIGIVSISREKNAEIEDTTSREGVITSKAYFDLVKYVTTSIKIFVDLRSEEESEKAKARKPKASRKKVAKKITIETPKVEENPPASQDGNFIDVKGEYPQNFYYSLEKEINDCYVSGYPNAAFFLCRKLIENLIYNILEKKFPQQEDLWWNKSLGYHLNLSPLMKNLNDQKNQFKPNVKTYIEKFMELAKDFRDETNNTSHNIYDYLKSKNDLAKYKVNDLIQLLINIYNNM